MRKNSLGQIATRALQSITIASFCGLAQVSAESSATDPEKLTRVDRESAKDNAAQELNTIFADILRMGSEASKAKYGVDLIGKMALDAGIDLDDPLGGENKEESTEVIEKNAVGLNNLEQEGATHFPEQFAKDVNGLLRTGVGMYGKLLQAELSQAQQQSDSDSDGLAQGDMEGKKVSTLIGAGNLKLLEGEYSAAEEIFTKALILAPGNAEIYYNLAVATSQQGKIARGARALNKAVTLDAVYKERALRDMNFIAVRDREEFKAVLESR